MSKKKSSGKPRNSPAAERRSWKSNTALIVIAVVLVGVAVGAVMFGGGLGSESDRSGEAAAENATADVLQIVEGEFLAIRTDEIGNDAAFFPMDVDGTAMEVLAVRASDGSIRTAFNTCQSCYASGAGITCGRTASWYAKTAASISLPTRSRSSWGLQPVADLR